MITNYNFENNNFDDVVSVHINKSIFQVSTLEVKLDNTEQNKVLLDFINKEISEFDNFNLVKLFIDEQISFVGVTCEYKYNETENTYAFKAQDFIYKLFRNIDCTPFLTFWKSSSHQAIKALFYHAGFNKNSISIDSDLIDYPISKIQMEYTSTYMDVLEKIFNTMYARFHVNKDGSIRITKAYPPYNGTPTVTEDINSINLISDGNYTRTETDIKNKLVVKASDTDIQAFQCPYLVDHCNSEIFMDTVEEQLANTEQKKKNVALRYFRDKLRHSKKFSVALVNGNLNREIGNIVRITMNQSNVKGWAMINSIKTSIENGEWKDALELELLVADTWLVPKPVVGNYIKEKPKETSNSKTPTKKRKVRRKRKR
ncbi:hypothetical protein [Clostridium botulinum]|uniref:hypothetical protein n=1 Tax=Clostridium botulinum TaxID=1491 RepID=UPI001E4F1427|nr:hypothetical protein [Clostridium botulinum]MCD3254342.1 hypothetical protein [Clostridium botulinum C/D]MCD3279842.1 hypothetical protein [Clostridium botulinum C/D]MCD3339621.1 hypothetical protein [Clostridium botulinum C/D]MCD3357481.1 hypothetical protein [Clostridium botulinum C/D]